MMRNILAVLGIVMLAAAPASALCLQDIGGIQFTLDIDKTKSLITGTATADADCDTTFWYVLGSFSRDGGPTSYEVTVVNPLGQLDTVCIPLYMIKGTWPQGAYFYHPLWTPIPAEIPPPFTWGQCTSLLPALETPQTYSTGQKK